MSNPVDLEREISTGLTELRSLLRERSTSSVAGWCFSYFMKTSHGEETEGRLASPAKQIPFFLGVLLSEPEPENPTEFGEADWQRAKSILDRLFSAYISLYMPSDEQLGNLAPEWHRSREVAMLAFLHYFNTGLMASVPQVVERIKTYLVPFDAELAAAIGISASQAIEVCDWIASELQDGLDRVQQSFIAVDEVRREVLSKAEKEGWRESDLRAAAMSPANAGKAEQLMLNLNAIGTVSLEKLQASFPVLAEVFWRQFSVVRGEGPEIRYPTERSVFEERPLIRIGDAKVFCPLANALFNAILFVGEKVLLQGDVRDKYLRARDKALEREVLSTIGPFVSPDAAILSEVYEAPDSRYEHDVIVVDRSLCLVIEAKAAPPNEPFRDPERAFVRLRDAFRSDKGIQKAFEQGNRIVRRLSAGEEVPLFDVRGQEIFRILPDKERRTFCVCVTRDNFGALATNLALLLEKSVDDVFPWVVNILDLESLAEAWAHFQWGPEKLRNYLEQRVQLHGKVFSDDELDYAGYFMRHGGFETAIRAQADLLQLNPDYSSIFDDLYRHLHAGGPPVTLKPTEPVLMDLRKSLAAGEPIFVDRTGQSTSRKKIGRNEKCPCGSGLKYKKCCGSIH